jgi:predicted GIY-YIG superfamily endonuclease
LDEVIYALIDPRDNLAFYIGRTKDIYRRFLQHIGHHENNEAKNMRIQELKALHLVPSMKTLEIIKGDCALAAEREAYWIRHHRSLGIALTNDVVYIASEKRTKQKAENIGDKEILTSYPEIRSEWLKKNKRTVSLDEVKQVTGQDMRKLKKAPLRRAARNDNLVLISSVIAWLKTIPLPTEDEPITNESPIATETA